MKNTTIELITRAVLYEEYVLHPHCPSVKHRERGTFGGVLPAGYVEAHGGSDADTMQTQCIVACSACTRLAATLRFLHPAERSVEQAPAFKRVQSIFIGGNEIRSWEEGIEREVSIDRLSIDALLRTNHKHSFSFPSLTTVELLHEGERLVGRIIHRRRAISGEVEISAKRLNSELAQLTVRVVNQTSIEADAPREEALRRSLASTHLILKVDGGHFFSLTDPPFEIKRFVDQCESIGCWPVLAGEADQTDTLLAAPIILPDYPQVAAESDGKASSHPLAGKRRSTNTLRASYF